jgi:hypothetical protein
LAMCQLTPGNAEWIFTKIKSKTTESEPIASHSTIYNETITTHTAKSKTIVPCWSETFAPHSLFQTKTIGPCSTRQSETIKTCSTNHIKQNKSSPTFLLVIASVKNNNALSFGDKSSRTFKLVVASIKNKDSKGPTNDSPAKQRPVPNNDPAITYQSFLQSLHLPEIATVIEDLVCDNSLSHPNTSFKLIVDSEGA